LALIRAASPEDLAEVKEKMKAAIAAAQKEGAAGANGVQLDKKPG